MKFTDSFLKEFSDDQLDQAESLIKREHPDLWFNMIKPTRSQMKNTSFYADFFEVVKNLSFIKEINDITALSYSLYQRSERKL